MRTYLIRSTPDSRVTVSLCLTRKLPHSFATYPNAESVLTDLPYFPWQAVTPRLRREKKLTTDVLYLAEVNWSEAGESIWRPEKELVG